MLPLRAHLACIISTLAFCATCLPTSPSEKIFEQLQVRAPPPALDIGSLPVLSWAPQDAAFSSATSATSASSASSRTFPSLASLPFLSIPPVHSQPIVFTGNGGVSSTVPLALSTTSSAVAPSPTSDPNITSGCGPISAYYNPTLQDWEDAQTDEWLDAWWAANNGTFAKKGGFAAAFAQKYLGIPGWTCTDNGSADDCDLNPCGQPILNAAGPEMRQAYYVLQSLNNLHSYFKGLGDALQISDISAALSKEDWAYTFYRDKNDVPDSGMKEIFNAVCVAVGVVAAFAAPFESAVKILASASNTIFSGGVTATRYALEISGNNTPEKAADLGAILAGFFVKSVTQFISANNDLMAGKPFLTTGDVRTYIKGGNFISPGGVDKLAVIEKSRRMLLSISINQLWKQQKIFIMGGGPCDDSGGIGSGPPQAKVCRDGRAWYLFFWKEYGGLRLGKKQWGNVDKPAGFDELNTGNYEGITYEDIINSSLDSNKVALTNYTADMYAQRSQSAMLTGLLTPPQAGPAWEGTFTIPVCNLSMMVVQEPRRAQIGARSAILQPWGNGMIPTWCAPICCDNNGAVSRKVTLDFIEAANMKNFDSFQAFCPNGPWAGWGETSVSSWGSF